MRRVSEKWKNYGNIPAVLILKASVFHLNNNHKTHIMHKIMSSYFRSENAGEYQVHKL